jgi:hypothetical protein
VKGEGANLKAMTSTLKFVVNCELLGWRKISKALALAMHFPKHASMGQQKKVCKKLYMFLLSLPNMICESA